MRHVIATIIGTLCIGSAALPQGPTVVATVSASGDSVVYNYTLTNTRSLGISSFDVFAPAAAANAITSYSTSQEGWDAGLSRVTQTFACISWELVTEKHGVGIASGCSADFGFTTMAGVPTTYSYTFGDTGTNWRWYDVCSNYGTTILPVPIPEPSSLLALSAGLVSAGAMRGRRRRR